MTYQYDKKTTKTTYVFYIELRKQLEDTEYITVQYRGIDILKVLETVAGENIDYLYFTPVATGRNDGREISFIKDRWTYILDETTGEFEKVKYLYFSRKRRHRGATVNKTKRKTYDNLTDEEWNAKWEEEGKN